MALFFCFDKIFWRKMQNTKQGSKSLKKPSSRKIMLSS
jgi:hypothetical protein